MKTKTFRAFAVAAALSLSTLAGAAGIVVLAAKKRKKEDED